MIDVWGVIANSLWILGLAVLLAALSWAHWVASSEGRHLRIVLGRPQTQRCLDLGLFLFCVGLVATSRAWWERILWGLLAAAWVIKALLEGINTRKTDAYEQESANANPNDNAL